MTDPYAIIALIGIAVAVVLMAVETPRLIRWLRRPRVPAWKNSPASLLAVDLHMAEATPHRRLSGTE